MTTPTDDRHAHQRALLILILANILFSLAGVVTRHLDQARSFEVTFWRSFFASIVLILWVLHTQRHNALRYLLASGRPGILSGCMWAIMYTCFMIALTLTSTANTLIVNALTPFIAALLAWFVLKTPIPRRTWFAICAAFTGILIMFADQASGDWLGIAVALGGPFAAATNWVTLKKIGARLDLLPAVLLGALISCLITLPLAYPFSASGKDIALLAFLGLFQLALPSALIIRSSRQLSAPEIALIGLFEVVLGPLFAWAGAGEQLAVNTLIGGAIVLAALIVNELMPRSRPRPQA